MIGGTGKYRPGDPVSFLLVGKRVDATVIEDRGAIGAHGRRLYRIRVSLPPAEPIEFELPEEELGPADGPRRLQPA